MDKITISIPSSERGGERQTAATEPDGCVLVIIVAEARGSMGQAACPHEIQLINPAAGEVITGRWAAR